MSNWSSTLGHTVMHAAAVFDSVFRHPLFLLLVGAVVSSLLIPAVTRSWQDHQKELELKTSLVSQISDSVTSLLMAVQFAELGATSQSQADYDKAYRDWEVKRAVISSLLQAYFPASRVGSDWDKYSNSVTLFYAVSGISDATRRREQLDLIRSSLSPDLGGSEEVNWDGFAQRGSAEYKTSWIALHARLLLEKDALVQRILNTRVVAF